MKSPTRITVLLADDHVIVREGLRKLLESESDIEVIGEATTGRQAVRPDQETPPRRRRHGHRDAQAQRAGSHSPDSPDRA